MKTISGIRRLLKEMPQPARGASWCFPIFFLLTFILSAMTGEAWVFSVGAVLAGLSIFLFGLCIFRNINGAAATWSRIYKETRGIPVEGFTFADVPTLRTMGFFYMVFGCFLLGGVLFAR